MNRHPYPAYRPSSINWLREIPADWQVRRLRYLASEPLMYGANEAASETDPSFPRFVRITDISEDGSLRPETFRSLPSEIAEPYLLREGDILLARSGATVGKTFIYRKEWGKACFAGYLIRFPCNRDLLLPDFLFCFTQSHIYWSQVRRGTIQATIQNFSAEKYGEILLPLPPLTEQRAVIAFLDRETTRIDALIEKKQRQIELLQEKRTALISHAVTKGLNPNANMKASGVEWLGEIPGHWEVSRLGYAFRLQAGFAFQSESFTYEGVPIVKMSNLKEGQLDLSSTTKIPDDQCMPEFALEVGDLVIGMSGSINNFAVVGERDLPCQLNQRAGRFLETGLKATFYPYLRYLVSSVVFMEQMELTASGTAQANISSEEIGHFSIALPSVEEQRAIAAFLDRETACIDALIEKVKKSIALLREYRTSLISAAVTGKIDVRKEAT